MPPADRQPQHAPAMERKRKLVEELGSDVCRCSRRKAVGKTFCQRCYHSLPSAIQIRLYKRIGDGYEEAYTDAITHLDRS